MLIGFAPPVTEAALEADDGLASALEHWRWTENAAACLEPNGIEVRVVNTDSVTVRSNGDLVTLEGRPSADPAELAPTSSPQERTLVWYCWDPKRLRLRLPGAAADFSTSPIAARKRCASSIFARQPNT